MSGKTEGSGDAGTKVYIRYYVVEEKGCVCTQIICPFFFLIEGGVYIPARIKVLKLSFQQYAIE